MPKAREKCQHTVSSSIRFAATPLAVAGWLIMSLPSTAVTIRSSYRNDFRSCAGRLLSVGVSSEAAAAACAAALAPRELSRCVADIARQTKIVAADALATCRQARRPNEIARCVVGISRNSEEQAVPGVLDYCGRSLLPVRFAECVVGLGRETDLAPSRAMETCIDASDPLANIAPGVVSPGQTPLVEPAPPAPAVPRDLTPGVEPTSPTTPEIQTPETQSSPTPLEPELKLPEIQPSPTPTVPENQTPKIQPSPTPTTPANPGV